MAIRIRFNLKWLLGGIAIAALGMWAVTQTGISRGQVTIVEQKLNVDADGRASGLISWRFVDGQRNVYGDYVCTVSKVGPSRMNDLVVGDRLTFRYRIQPLPGFAAQNPHRVFLTRVLRIRESDIVGYARMRDWTEIVLSGGESDPQDSTVE